MRLLTQERKLRLQVEKQRDEIESKCIDYQQQMKEVHETLVCHSSFLMDFIKLFTFYF